MPDGLPSLELIAERVTQERRAIAAHADALDAKAGIVLGFSGAFVALALPHGSIAVKVAAVFAAAAAVTAMAAFFPRPYPVLGLDVLRNKYIRADPSFTLLTIVDTEIEVREKTRTLIRRKSRLLGTAIVLLGAALTSVVAGSTL